MSDNDSSEVRGPVMIAATKIIKPPPARIGSIGGNITLPRTVEVRKLAAGGVGAGVGVMLSAAFGSLQFVLFGAIIGGFVGVALMSWSPSKGETFLQWIGVNAVARARQKRLRYGGDTVAVYIGVARLHRVNLGSVHLVPGAIDVLPDQVDERGVLRAAHNRNLAPLRPHRAERPQFTPLYAQDLPEEMLAATGSFSGVERRAVVDGPGAGQATTAPGGQPPASAPYAPLPAQGPAAGPAANPAGPAGATPGEGR